MLKKKIKQEDDFGCGVACTAKALNISYIKSLSLFSNGKFRASHNGFLCEGIKIALSKKGKKYDYYYSNNKLRRQIYSNGTIVFIKRSKKYPSGHYLYRDNEKWMDPWINFAENKNIKYAIAGYRNRLPSGAIYTIIRN